MKKTLLIFGILLSTYILSFAQACLKPAIDTATGKTIASGGLVPYPTSFTWNHSVSGSNTLLVVEVGGNVYCDSVTYAGVKMTRLDTIGNGSYKAEMWYSINPPAGTNAVLVSYPAGSGTFNPSKSAEAITFINVDQNNPFGTVAKDTGSSCPTSVKVKSDTSQTVLDMIVKNYFYSPTADPSQTKVYGVSYATYNAVAGSVKPGADSLYMKWSWTFCGAYAWAAIAAPIMPYCAVTSIAETQDGAIAKPYPNPASCTLHYEINAKENAGYNLVITDLAGKIVLSETAKVNHTGINNMQVNVSALSSGMYFLKVINDKGAYSTARFIKTGF